MDIGEQTTGTWAPPAPDTLVPVPDAWGDGAWPPPTGPPVTGRRPRPGWATAVICILAGVVAVAGMVAVGFVLPEPYPSHWDARVAGLAAYVEQERGLDFKHPVPVDFLDEDEFVATVTTDEADLTDADRGDIEDDEAVARALGLAGTATDFVAAENTLSGEGILAYYDSEAKRITVRGTGMTVSLRITLVHELVHVLQDQHFDLSRRGSYATTAQNSAFDAVVEGDAVSIENLYYWSLPDTERAAYDAALAGQISDMEAGTADVPGWMAASAQAPYVLGEPFVTALVAARGAKAVDEALRRPPATEEQLMDVRRFLAGDDRRPVKTPRPADGDRVIEERDFGTLSWLFLLAERIPAFDALAAADGWGGDAYLAFERDGKVCTRAAFVGDTAADTDEMTRALDRWATGLPAGQASVRRSGAAVELSSCDPGLEAAGPTLSGAGSGPEVAMALLATRATTFAGALDGGADEEEAGCVATGMLSEFSPDELAAPELPADFEARRGRLEERCR
jgi:hypothetical protein